MAGRTKINKNIISNLRMEYPKCNTHTKIKSICRMNVGTIKKLNERRHKSVVYCKRYLVI